MTSLFQVLRVNRLTRDYPCDNLYLISMRPLELTHVEAYFPPPPHDRTAIICSASRIPGIHPPSANPNAWGKTTGRRPLDKDKRKKIKGFFGIRKLKWGSVGTNSHFRKLHCKTRVCRLYIALNRVGAGRGWQYTLLFCPSPEKNCVILEAR